MENVIENLNQLNKQTTAMLNLCDDFEKNAYPGGQLQTQYLRADMTLWKA
jgi:hypothetical protein